MSPKNENKRDIPLISQEAFLCLIVFADFFCYSMAVPVLSPLIGEINGTSIPSWLIILVSVVLFDVGQIIASPILGSLSDRIGRKPIFIISFAGLTLSNMGRAWSPGVTIFLLASLVHGVFAANIATAYAAASDRIPPSRRLATFSRITAALNAGYIIGPALGGFMALSGIRIPLWAGVLVSATLLISIIFWFRESLDPQDRAHRPIKYVSPFRYINDSNRPNLRRISYAYAIHQLVLGLIPIPITMYLVARYGFNEPTVGIFLTVLTVISFLLQAFFVTKLVQRFGAEPCVILGLLTAALGLMILGGSMSAWTVWVSGILIAGRAISTPIMMSRMSAEVTASEQGMLQSVNLALTSFTRIMMQLVFGATYFLLHRFFDPHWWGAPFLLASVALCISTIIIRITARDLKILDQPPPELLAKQS